MGSIETVSAACKGETSIALTFRNGLGNSIFATPGHHVTAEDVKAFAQSVFGAGNVAVLGTGIEAGALEELLQKSLGKFSSSASPSSTPSSYFGDETRTDAHHAPQTVFVGFGTAGAPAPELAVLASHLDPTPGPRPLLRASLLAPQKAVAKAKFSAASAFDVGDNLVSAVGPKILSGSPTSITDAVSALEKVDASAYSKRFRSLTRMSTPYAASSLLKSKPTFVAVGDIASLPYADELGL
ncbi:hypothetical protein L227DRAFT_561576 [Lentinus tigrinus ALCF2SS1-6]|uniref:Peptidase M16 N-terminal domain-containing protein n=1 Tax=Lentinus tigrinus ALCF2SS1-6 TaxID=1328759 RepID=A0A5C2SI40_9APHY|nr:hypothetical protein L227DRAFT_561576 [Lentinus tigrinus ALCF2SS1-6]